MLAVFLSPIYLLFQAYILLWLYAWADSCHSPLSIFCRQPADRISDHKRTTSPFSPGDQQLLARHSGIYPAFYHHLRRDPPCHRPFLLYEIPVPGHAAYHAEKSSDLWRLCHWPDPYGQHLRCPACKTGLCAAGSGRHRKEFLSSGT